MRSTPSSVGLSINVLSRAPLVKSRSSQVASVQVFNNYSYAGSPTDGCWWQNDEPELVRAPSDNTQFNMTLRSQAHLASVTSLVLPTSVSAIDGFEFQNYVGIVSYARRSDCAASDIDPSCDVYFEAVGHIVSMTRIF